MGRHAASGARILRREPHRRREACAWGVSGVFPNSRTQNGWICNPNRDRLHPSTQGHKRIAEALAREIGRFF